jgi:hypothetical protein
MSKEFDNTPETTNDIGAPDFGIELGAFESEPIFFVAESAEKQASHKGFVGGFFELMNEAAATYRVEEVGMKVAEIESSLNYDKVAKNIVTGEIDEEIPGQLDRVMVSSELIKNGAMDLSDLEVANRDAVAWKKNLEGQGYLGLDVERDGPPLDVDESLLDRIRNAPRAQLLAEQYKSKDPPELEHSAMTALQDVDGQVGIEPTVESWREYKRFYSQPLEQAIKGQLTRNRRQVASL